MKKTLIALAAVAATGAAFAQSSVTLYGVADMAVGKQTNQKFKAFAAERLNNADSRWGIRGSEDLGGGLKANFNFEQGVNIATGGTTTGNGNSNPFQRAAFLSLTGGFGEVYGGRRLTPHFFSIASYELTGTANYSVVSSLFGYGGAARNDAFVGYTTPNMNGLTATFGTRLAGNSAGNNEKYDLNVIYRSGPIVASLGYDKTKNATRNVSFGGSYNFGAVKVAASYQDPSDARKGFTVGASAPMGPVTLTFDLARDTGSTVKSTDYVLEAKYSLSKRTFAYGVLHRDGSAKVNLVGVGVRHNF